MLKFRIHWYNQQQIVKVEPELIMALNKEDAECKAYMLYSDGKVPAPLIWAEEV